MVFSSLTFVCLFLPLVGALYLVLPRSASNPLLVVASLVFYGWGEPGALVLVGLSVIVNFRLGLLLEGAKGSRRRRLITAAVAMNLLVLIVFKYAGFLVQNVNALVGVVSTYRLPEPRIALPLGISFFTFHLISYLVDVFRGVVPAQRSVTAFTLYIVNFPQLIAGPIIRYRQIAGQLESRQVTFDDVNASVARFTAGLAKKLLVANPVGAIADQVSPSRRASSRWAPPGSAFSATRFRSTSTSPATPTWRSGWRGCSGSASRKLREPVRRHLDAGLLASLAYLPLVVVPRLRVHPTRGQPWGLVGNRAQSLDRVPAHRGLHGASWNFIAWGMWHGLFLWIERLDPFRQAMATSPSWARRAYVLLVVMLGWVFFRAPTLGAAFEMLRCLLSATPEAAHALPAATYLSLPMLGLIVVAGCLAFPVWPHLRAFLEQRAGGAGTLGVDLARAALIGAAIVLALATMAVEQHNPFIYFRF